VAAERTHYDASYGHFQSGLYEEIRREAFGEDIGQQSWITAAEQDRFIRWLNLGPGRTLLDVACGAGGPALRIAATTGCAIAGIDLHEQAIATARALASERGLSARARFEQADAQQALSFPDARFDAVTCIDAINHLPDRPRVIGEWARVLKPGGRLFFSDPVVVTGPLSSAEIASRSAIGFFLFVPIDYDERVIAQCGLRLLAREDTTAHMAAIAERRSAARASRRAALLAIEGEKTYQAQQDFFETVARLGHEGRLSRFMYVARRLG
jgi:2-polyprenyl-3-methyl-5-hydroxy-6-metoxy-1,4-benzoquinol methylase